MLPDELIRVLPTNPALFSTSGNISIKIDSDKIYQPITLTGNTVLLFDNTNTKLGATVILDIQGAGYNLIFPGFSNIGAGLYKNSKRNLLFLQNINGLPTINIFQPSLLLTKDINVNFVGNSIGTQAQGDWYDNLKNRLTFLLTALGYSLNVTYSYSYTAVGEGVGDWRNNLSLTQSKFDSTKTNVLLAVGEPLHTYDTGTQTAQYGADDVNNYCQLVKQGNPDWHIVVLTAFRITGGHSAFNEAQYNTLQDDVIIAFKNQITSGTNNFDALAVVDTIYNYNDRSFSFEGLHPNPAGYVNGEIISRACYGILEALLGVQQPSNIVDNNTILPIATRLTFSSQTNLTDTGGIITTSNPGSFGNTGVSSLKLYANQAGWIATKVNAAENQNFVFGFYYAQTQVGWGNFPVGFQVNGTAVSVVDSAGNYIPNVASVATFDYVRLRRDASGVFYLEILRNATENKTNWDLVRTFTTGYAGDLWATIDVSQRCDYPQYFNLN